eukprot:4861338-Amphidinium_carterae.1
MKTLYLLLDITNIEPLDNYGEKIRDYHDLYGTKCWWLIYQADMRMRSDEFERIRRKLESQRAQALAAGAGEDVLKRILESGKPWDSVLKAAASDESA